MQINSVTRNGNRVGFLTQTRQKQAKPTTYRVNFTIINAFGTCMSLYFFLHIYFYYDIY